MFQQQKRLQNGVNAFVENGFRKRDICQKAQICVHFGLHDLVQISPAYGPSTYQKMYGDTLDFQCQNLQR